ncbi:MAG: glycoside hydrolase family 88 protein [Melioribacteraceae bacterium]|nr:glycoside hydrolase family 88 protein [Melioribacteraceae bacterium]
MIKKIILILLWYSIVYSQSPIDFGKRVATKIIDDTSFEFYTQIQKPSSGLQIINFKQNYPNKSADVVYAFSEIISGETEDVLFGVSSSSALKIWINDELLFSGVGDSLNYSNVAYSMYEFKNYFTAHLNKGANDILIKMDNKEGAILALAPIYDDGLLKSETSFSIVSLFKDDKPNSNWLLIGFQNESFENILPPEKAFTQNYFYQDKYYNWILSKSNLILNDVIKENVPFQSHSYFEWHYANGQMLLGMFNVYDLTKDSKLLEYIKKNISVTSQNYDYFKYQYEVLNEKAGFNNRLYRKMMLDDTGAPALAILEANLRGIDKSSRFILDDVADYIMNKQVRLEDGTFCRPEPKKMSIWADDLFMSVPFLLRYANLTNDAKYFDEATNQIKIFSAKLRDKETGLYYHGWFSENNQHSPIHWGRANGWLIWAISETLSILPESHNDYKTVKKIYLDHINALVKYQNESGLWNQVLDNKETFEETSASSMFIMAIARGINNKWLPESYKDFAIKGWNAITNRIKVDGTVNGICQGTGIGDNIEFYQTRKTPPSDPRGLGAVLSASVEIQKLINK